MLQIDQVFLLYNLRCCLVLLEVMKPTATKHILHIHHYVSKLFPSVL